MKKREQSGNLTNACFLINLLLTLRWKPKTAGSYLAFILPKRINTVFQSSAYRLKIPVFCGTYRLLCRTGNLKWPAHVKHKKSH